MPFDKKKIPILFYCGDILVWYIVDMLLSVLNFCFKHYMMKQIFFVEQIVRDLSKLDLTITKPYFEFGFFYWAKFMETA